MHRCGDLLLIGEGMKKTLDLAGPLKGQQIEIEEDELTFGFLEDLESGSIKLQLDALSAVIVGGDLPNGTDRKGLRRLRGPEVKAICDAIGGAFRLE